MIKMSNMYTVAHKHTHTRARAHTHTHTYISYRTGETPPVSFLGFHMWRPLLEGPMYKYQV
jgi:hypothetical protein